MKKKIFVYSHVGNSRENQEDNFFVDGREILTPINKEIMEKERKCYTKYIEQNDSYCVAVSDGMGGYECGEIASFLTVQYINSHRQELMDLARNNGEEIGCFVKKLNKWICEEAKKKKETQNMGATLCGIVAVDNGTYCFNVGDSRMYQYSCGILKQITVDDTEGQRLLDLGLLTEAEIKNFPKRKALYKYIGKDVELVPNVYEIKNIEKGTMLLLCSDGLSDVVKLEEIQDMLSKQYIKTEDKGKFLVEMAVERKLDAGDNITLIIIEY